jgi:predicted RNA-binding protein Jag
MLFEAFESDALSKMMKFLSKKVSSNSKEMFKEKLKRLITQFDIPIDKIGNADVKYLNRNQALKLRNVDKVENYKGIYCLKFWFSMDQGYLGFTGTGNDSMDFKSYIANNNNNRNRIKYFSDYELDYIKDKLNIKTGKLTPVKNYDEDLPHRQLVIGIFSDSVNNIQNLGLAKIWRDGDEIHFIQSVAGGGEPSFAVGGERWRDWVDNDAEENENGYKPFSRSWSMGSVNSPGSDHHKLHIYTPSEEPLHIEGLKKEEEKKEEAESPFDFNLPLNSYYDIKEWGESSWSIDDYKIVETSDFSIVLMIDDILKSVKNSVNKIKTDREESRKGATKLMSNSEIKKANIERYLTTMVSKMGIEKDIKEIKNLQKLVIKSVCGDLAFISIYRDRPGFNILDRISSSIYDMIGNGDEVDKDYHLSSIISSFKNLNSSSEEYIKKYNDSLKVINESGIEPVIEIFKMFIEIGKKIKNYLLSQNIQTIEDLGIIMVKLRSIRNIFGEKAFLLGYTGTILNELQYCDDVRYYINRYDEKKTNEVLEDIKKVKHIEKYIDSLLR